MKRPHPRRLSLPSLQSAVLLAALAVLVALGLATRQALIDEYERSIHHELRLLEGTAQKLATRTRQLLDQADQTTMIAKSLYETGNPMDLTGLRHAGLVAYEATRAVYRADARGLVIDSTTPKVPLHIGDDEEFKRHRRYNDLGLTLGQPARDVLGSGWGFSLMRSLSRDGSSFEGVVVSQIDAAALTQAFAGAQEPGHSLTVVGLDGIVRSRFIHGELSVGETLDFDRLDRDVEATRRTLHPVISPFDGQARFVTSLPVDRYPLRAVVGMSAERAMTAYRHARTRLLAAAAGLAALLFAGTFSLWRQAGRLAASQRVAARAQALYRATLDGSMDAVTLMQAQRDDQQRIIDYRVTDANRLAAQLLGHGSASIVGERLRSLLPRLQGEDAVEVLGRVLATGQRLEIEEEADRLMRPGRWLHHQIVPVEDGVALISRDVTERVAAQHQLAAMARLDPLTQLPNRRHFEEQLEQVIARAARQAHAVALIYLDLDGFKQVNDTLGHAAGDQLLIEVARRLKACTRAGDVVARLGGDEFTVIVEQAATPEDRDHACERLLHALSQACELAGRELVVTPSIGAASWRPGESVDSLMRRADSAMYQAKRAGKACFRVAPQQEPALALVHDAARRQPLR